MIMMVMVNETYTCEDDDDGYESLPFIGLVGRGSLGTDHLWR
jgi:hypothetical protein